MPNENEPSGLPDGGQAGTPAATAAAGTPADAGTGAPSTPAATPPADAGGWRNVEEIKQALKATRENEKLLKSFLPLMQRFEKLTQAMAPDGAAAQTSATPPPAPGGDAALAKVQELERRLALKDAYDEFKVPAGPHREVIELAARSYAGDVRELVQKMAGLGQAPAATPNPPAAPSNTGAPSAGGSRFIPENPRALLPESANAMTRAEKTAHFKQWAAKTSSNHNPLAAKARPQQGPDLNKALAELLSRAATTPKR